MKYQKNRVSNKRNNSNKLKNSIPYISLFFLFSALTFILIINNSSNHITGLATFDQSNNINKDPDFIFNINTTGFISQLTIDFNLNSSLINSDNNSNNQTTSAIAFLNFNDEKLLIFNISSKINTTTSFTDLCNETCNFNGNSTNYKIAFFVENCTLDLSRIKYLSQEQNKSINKLNYNISLE